MKLLFGLVKVLVIISALLCVILYFIQEKLIFFPEKLDKDFRFSFDQPFEEISIKSTGSVLLNGLLFKTDSSRGLIFYLHGNAGSLASWGDVAKTYTDLNYDVFLPDYRGYGKSGGAIKNQAQFFEDVQLTYNEIKKRYTEDKIIVIGYSIGTGPAAKIAATNHPRLLILQAPYYSLTDMLKHSYPFVPAFILKYKFETSKYLKDCQMPVVIFHGDLDEVIYYESSLKLKKHFKKTDSLITLNGQGHNRMTDNRDYKITLKQILK